MPQELELRLERPRYVPGETVHGLVRVPDDSREARVHVTLTLRERSTEYEAVVETIPVEVPVAAGDDGPKRKRRFVIEIPPDALPTQRSRHGGLYWTVDAGEGEGSVGTSLPIEIGPPPRERSTDSPDLGADRPPPG